MAPFVLTFLDRDLAPQKVLSSTIYYCVLQVIYLLTRSHLGSHSVTVVQWHLVETVFLWKTVCMCGCLYAVWDIV